MPHVDSSATGHPPHLVRRNGQNGRRLIGHVRRALLRARAHVYVCVFYVLILIYLHICCLSIAYILLFLLHPAGFFFLSTYAKFDLSVSDLSVFDCMYTVCMCACLFLCILPLFFPLPLPTLRLRLLFFYDRICARNKWFFLFFCQ